MLSSIHQNTRRPETNVVQTRRPYWSLPFFESPFRLVQILDTIRHLATLSPMGTPNLGMEAWRLRDWETRRLPRELQAIPPGLVSSLGAYAYRSATRPSAAAALAEAAVILCAAAAGGFEVEGEPLKLRLVALDDAAPEVGGAARSVAKAAAFMEPRAGLLLARQRQGGGLRVLCAANGHTDHPGPTLFACTPSRWCSPPPERLEVHSAALSIACAPEAKRRRRLEKLIEPPPHVSARLAELIALAHHQQSFPVQVARSDRARAALAAYQAECAQAGAERPVAATIHSPAPGKALRVAALIAIGRDYYAPTINLREAEFGIDLAQQDAARLVAGLRRGIDASADFQRQIAHVREKLNEYRHTPLEKLQRYRPEISAQMVEEGLIPHSYINARLQPVPAFRRSPLGGSASIQRALNYLIEAGEVRFATDRESATRRRDARLYKLLEIHSDAST